MNFANTKINLMNWVVIGLMAITFIVLMKLLVTKFKVPGLTEVVTMA